MLLTAKFFRRARRIEFYLQESKGLQQLDDFLAPGSPSSPSKRPRPAFVMTHSENNDNWVLSETRCRHCMQRPQHLSCEALGKTQQVAFIQHSRRKVGKALVHFVDVRIPALVDDTESMVWCPVTLGRDLCERSPAQSIDSTPRRRRQVFHSKSGSWGDATPKMADRSRSDPGAGQPQEADEEEADPLRLCTKLPEWDEYLESLVLNFNNRTVQSCPMNFMLCAATDTGQELIMQHAKLSKNTYCLDFKHPLSTVQGFAIALSALLWD